MKRTKKLLLIAGIACTSFVDSNAATVQWGNEGNGITGNSLGQSGGSLAPQGSLVRLGYFTVSDAQVQADAAAGLRTTLNTEFQEFGSSTIGTSLAIDGIWGDTSVHAATGFASQQIYYWTLNAATLGAATEWGIFTNPAWLFPSDLPVPGSIATDLMDVPQNGTGLIVGSFGGGPDANFGTSLYQMSAIPSAVPEPSTYAIGALTGLVAVATLRRRRQKQAQPSLAS